MKSVDTLIKSVENPLWVRLYTLVPFEWSRMDHWPDAFPQWVLVDEVRIEVRR